MTTAVEGGHITDLGASNRIIREIVEARNAARHPASSESVATLVRRIDEEECRRPNPVENPKDTVGSTKLPLHLWPTAATAMGSVALLNGALKYGRNNWRRIGVRASIYVDACQRHLSAWFEGEQVDEEGVPHLGAALACLAIIIDCEAAGKLIDDRQYPGGHRELMEALTPIVKQLQERHADKSPKHYTIGDAA